MILWIDTLPIRSVTKLLVNELIFDLPLSIPVITDFGVDSEDHYRVLKEVLLNDDTCLNTNANGDYIVAEENSMQRFQERILEIDEAYGNGPMLNDLVKKYAPQYAKIVHFQTSWDVICGREENVLD